MTYFSKHQGELGRMLRVKHMTFTGETGISRLVIPITRLRSCCVQTNIRISSKKQPKTLSMFTWTVIFQICPDFLSSGWILRIRPFSNFFPTKQCGMCQYSSVLGEFCGHVNSAFGKSRFYSSFCDTLRLLPLASPVALERALSHPRDACFSPLSHTIFKKIFFWKSWGTLESFVSTLHRRTLPGPLSPTSPSCAPTLVAALMVTRFSATRMASRTLLCKKLQRGYTTGVRWVQFYREAREKSVQ